jgi:hypothetical protein
MSLSRQNISFNNEYLFFVLISIVAGYLLMSSTNLFLAIFILEFIALLIFGKFTVSRILYNYNLIDNARQAATPQFSYGLFNSLFFQF